MDLSNYYLRRHYHCRVGGDHTEWRVHRKTYDESLWYIIYNKARDLDGEPHRDCPWIWFDWYTAEKCERQVWFKDQQSIIIGVEEDFMQKNFYDVCVDMMCKPTNLKLDVAKDFQDKYESSNNGQYWGAYFDGAEYNRPKGSTTSYPLAPLPCTAPCP